jgi:hypothetical protein
MLPVPVTVIGLRLARAGPATRTRHSTRAGVAPAIETVRKCGMIVQRIIIVLVLLKRAELLVTVTFFYFKLTELNLKLTGKLRQLEPEAKRHEYPSHESKLQVELVATNHDN